MTLGGTMFQSEVKRPSFDLVWRKERGSILQGKSPDGKGKKKSLPRERKGYLKQVGGVVIIPRGRRKREIDPLSQKKRSSTKKTEEKSDKSSLRGRKGGGGEASIPIKRPRYAAW